MYKEMEYCTEKYNFMIKFFLISIVYIMVILGTIFLDFTCVMNNKDIDFTIKIDTILTLGCLIILWINKPIIMVCGRSKFKIAFYKDRFYYKGIMKNKIIKYKEVQNITEIATFTRRGGLGSDKEILKISFKGKKDHGKIYITLAGLNDENKKKLKKEFEDRTLKNIGYDAKFILFVR